ncbi:MAG: class I SAM-dependent rRNA methyltransferase [Spirochaetaceae bacterium]|jgi:23S rRNA (cytosine1962-C5)-methyltransferase|nr:class I SAM-dependent rRNA methyltransferase [Spirochaetaceae bacterium]
MKRIILKPGEERRILAGHPWVYDNEVAAIIEGKAAIPAKLKEPVFLAELTAGECADVEGVIRGKPVYLGRAIVNPNSHIIARIYSPSKEGLDKGFFKRRIREALERRIAAGYDLSKESARMVFGEADSLPGLIIDRFVGRPADGSDAGSVEPSSWLVIQFLSYGMDCRRDMILDALKEIGETGEVFGRNNSDAIDAGSNSTAYSGIIEKSAPVRELEGLPLQDGLICGSFPAGGIIITENGLSFLADLQGGQKTGHFLDQRNNRRLTGEYAGRLAEKPAARNLSDDVKDLSGDVKKNFRILDCFCYTGGFGITAGKAAQAALSHADSASETTAVSVTAVDASSAALNLAQKNAALNGIAYQTIEADVFDFLRQADRSKEKYDLVILDPPAFAKNRAALEGALRGYKEINLRAMRLLAKGGMLVSCSCSQAMDEGRFKRMIADAATDAEKRLIQTDFRYQPPDHPILVGYDESLYLKCGFYLVC